MHSSGERVKSLLIRKRRGVLMLLVLCLATLFLGCSRYPVEAVEDAGGDGPVTDAADAGEEPDGRGDSDIAGPEEDDCQAFEIRVAACTGVVMGGWVPCPDDSFPPEECQEDCIYIDRSLCLQWWIDNVCIWEQDDMLSLEPDFSAEKVMLLQVGGALGAFPTAIEGEICSRVAQVVVDVCALENGSMDSGTLYAVAIPRDLDPSVVTRNVFCGISCDQTDWCDYAGASKEYSCSPYDRCPP
jgi:hypothetical protein